MKCQTCLENTQPDRWASFVTEDPDIRDERNRLRAIYGGADESKPAQWVGAEEGTRYSFDWMRCGNEDCTKLVVRMHKTTVRFLAGGGPVHESESWIVLPRFAAIARFIDPGVPAELREDLNEAVAFWT